MCIIRNINTMYSSESFPTEIPRLCTNTEICVETLWKQHKQQLPWIVHSPGYHVALSSQGTN